MPARPRRAATPSDSSSSTPWYSSQVRSRYEYARWKRVKSARSSHSSQAHAATICCASTSSGFCGISTVSRSPSRTALRSAVHSINSSRVMAKRMPLEMPALWWPARPTRWSSTEMARVLPSCTTRSTLPTSMPNSSDAVATMARSWPDFSFSSAASRISRDMLPWCAATVPSPRRSPKSCATRSAIFRVLTKTSVVRCAPVSSTSRS